MAKTKEEKALYCQEWRKRNREKYLEKKRIAYQKNKKRYREEALKRAKERYYSVIVPRRKNNPEFYRKIDRQHSLKRAEIKRKHLRELRERLGGKCSHCSYHEVIDILQFHHVHSNKENNVSNTQSYGKREREAFKCILLCPNCHAIETLKTQYDKSIFTT